MDRPSIDSLLHEAQTFAVHAARTGTLPQDSRIFEEIGSTAQALERGEHPPIAPLMFELQKLSEAAGITLKQFTDRTTSFGRLRLHAARVTPFLVGFATLLLTLYLAFQSSELHKADLALREYQELVNERLQEKIYLAWKMYHYEDVLNLKGPPLAQLDSYQKLVDDSKRLYGKRLAVQNLLLDSAVIRLVPDWLGYEFSARDAASSDLPEAVELPAKDCPPTSSDAVAEDKQANGERKISLPQYIDDVGCFVRSLQISAYDYPVDPLIYATRNKVHLLMSWLLPALYGLLGACVFVMRALLRTSYRSKTGREVRIVDLLSLLLRVALGGLAGIIIGWFSVPTSPTASSSAIAVSSIPFGLAFLAGYGIESLFSLLDRLNKTLAQPTEAATATEEPPSAESRHARPGHKWQGRRRKATARASTGTAPG